MFLRKQRRTEAEKRILSAIYADKRRRDREQSRWTWRNKRNVGFSLFISICVFWGDSLYRKRFFMGSQDRTIALVPAVWPRRIAVFHSKRSAIDV